MARGVLKLELIEAFKGRRRGVDGCDQDRLIWFRKIASSWTELEKEALCLRDGRDFAGHGSIVGIPRLSGGWDCGADCFGERSEGESIKDHGKGVSLRDAFTRKKDCAGLASTTEN
jgi:hypothetical protein